MKARLAVLCLFATGVFADPACHDPLSAPRAYVQDAYERVFTADFNGDGRLDVAFSGEGSFTIRHGLGGGRLTDPQVLPFEVLDVADVVGDSLPDLIAAYGQGGISPMVDVYRNLGGGRFAEPFPVNGWLSVAADFTNDGRGDLLTADGGFLHFYERVGAELRNRPTQQIDVDARELEAGDLNGDGFADLLVLSSDGSAVHVLINNGHGVFTRQRILDPGEPAVELEAADLRGDGRADALTISPSPELYRARIEIFPNGEQQSAATAVQNPEGFPSNLLVRDITGDGAPDVLMLMTYPGVAPRVVVLVNEGGVLKPVPTTLYAQAGFPLDTVPIEAGDFTGDGIAELVLPTPNGFALVTGRGDGTFHRDRELAGIGSENTEVGDVNNDGAEDLVFLKEDGILQAAVNDGAARFTLETLPRTFPELHVVISISRDEITVTDLGRSGFLRPVHVFRRNAVGVWTETRLYESLAQSAQTRDLNGDGRSELILIESDPFEEGQVPRKVLTVLSGTGDDILFEAPLGRYMGVGMAIDDVTGDGRPDLVVTSGHADPTGPYPPPRDGSVQIFAGLGDATFQAPLKIAADLTPVLDPLTGDFNGDGRLDIAFTTAHSELFVAYGISNGFAPLVRVGGFATYARAGDLDRDGITDLLAASGTELTVWTGSRDGLTRGSMYWSTGTSWRLARLTVGAPYSLVSTGDFPARVVDTRCASRRRSVGR